VWFSKEQPTPFRLAGSPKVLKLICTQPVLLLLVTVVGAACAEIKNNSSS
jgi:hypothetical protein